MEWIRTMLGGINPVIDTVIIVVSLALLVYATTSNPLDEHVGKAYLAAFILFGLGMVALGLHYGPPPIAP